MFCSHVRYVCLYVCMYICMHVCTKSFLKTTTNSSCVCTHLANKADSDSDSDSEDQSKKGFAKQESSSSLKYVHLCTQYLVGAPLAQTPASVRCGMETISLWLCRGTIESSARLDCWIDCFSSFS